MRISPSSQNRGATLALLLIVSLASRVVWWVTRAAVIENEGAEYARLAENWFAGRGYVGLFGGPHVLFPPLYPGLIGLLTLPLGSSEFAGRIVSLVSGLALVVLLWQLSRRLFGDTIGLIAGLLASLHPLLVALSVSVYCESLAMSLVVLGAYLAIGAIQEPSRWRTAGAGAAIGCAYLVRPEAIAFLAPVGLALLVNERRRGETWSTAVRRAAVPLLVAAVVALPYVASLSIEAGQFRWEGKTAINNILNARMQRGMSYSEAARGLTAAGEPDDPFHRGPYLSADQAIFFGHPPAGTGSLFPVTPGRVVNVVQRIVLASFLGSPLILLLALAGLAGSRWWRERPLEGGLVLAFGLLQAAYLVPLLFTWNRFLFPLLPLLIPWAAAGLQRVGRWTALAARPVLPSRWIAIVPGSMIVALMAVLVLRLYPRVEILGEFHQATDRSVKEAGLWIRRDAQGRARDVVMGFGSALPYYAGAVFSYLPYTDEDRAIRYIHTAGADYIAIRSSETGQAPYSETWLRRGIPDPCAVPAHEVTGADGTVSRVWRWTCRN